MSFDKKVGLCNSYKPGMFVRVPVEGKRPDSLYRDFRIGKIIRLNEEADTIIVSLLNYSLGERPITENLECSLRDTMRCRALPDTKAKLTNSGDEGKILIDCENTWTDGEYKQYYVEVGGEIECISEADLLIPSHRQNPHPFQQLQSYEMQHPSWKKIRDKVVTSISELRNATYGLDDLVGSRVRLLAHQAEVIARVLGDAKCRFILADEVGLGKTIEACVILKGLRRRNRDLKTLILVPDSLTVQWKNELDQKFWMNFPILSADGKIPADIKIPGVIVSLEALETNEAISFALYGMSCDLLIVDEAHHVTKNEILFERVKLLSEQSSRTLILSATPIQRRAEEFLKLLTLMDPKTYGSLKESKFMGILDAQDRIRRKIAYLTQLLDSDDFDGTEFVEEFLQVQMILKSDKTFKDLIKRLQTNLKNPSQAKEISRYIIAYISENYRIESRVIRNRRINLTIEFPIRQVDTSYAYSLGPEESLALHSLYDYFDLLIKRPSIDQVLLEYCRLILFSAASSPHALVRMLDRRRKHLSSKNPGNYVYHGDISRPGAPRQEPARINRIIQSIPLVKDESIALDSLVWQVNAWKEKLEQSLKGHYSTHTPPLPDSPNRLLQVIRAVYQITKQGDLKVIIFGAWKETLDILEDTLKANFGDRKIARFSCDMELSDLEKAADRFQSEDDCQILISDELGGEGRNFQIADYVIHVDIPWTPAVLEQRIGRVDRLGRTGKVISIIPYAKATVEADLFMIWQDAFNLFTQSMSGMEIALEGIQDELGSALVNSVRDGLAGIKNDMIERAKELRETVEEERYFEQGAINHRRRAEIEATSRKYQDGSVIHGPFLDWAEMAGLNYSYTSNKEILYFKPRSFNLASMNNARFVEPPNMEEALLRSRRQHNLVITGTFNRDIAIREEDLVFFAPGNDPWTDAILKNSLETDRGRCCGIGRVVSEIETNMLIFDLFYSILVDPRPLYRNGYNSTHLFRAQGYLQTPYYRILVTKEGDVLPKNHPAWLITKKFFIPAQDFHLGKRDGSKAQIQKFQSQYNPHEWSVILKDVLKAAEEKIKEEFEFVKDLAKEAREEFTYQAAGQRAALEYLYVGKDNGPSFDEVDKFEKISKALVDGIGSPIFELESVCVWMFQGTPKNE